MHNKFGIVACS